MKFVVSVNWTCEVEATDEGDALIQADSQFNFLTEADAEPEEEEL